MSFNTRITLIEKLKTSQDDAAWDDFHRNYSGYLAAVIRNLNVNEGDIDDVLQKVMLTSWQKIPEFEYDRSRGRFRSWLVQIARNTVMNHVTRRTRHASKLEQYGQEVNSPDESEVETMMEKEWRSHVSKLAWSSIRDNYELNAAQSFDLIAQGKSNKEVAAELGLKPNTVAVYKKRIIEALRKEIRRLDSYLG